MRTTPYSVRNTDGEIERDRDGDRDRDRDGEKGPSEMSTGELQDISDERRGKEFDWSIDETLGIRLKWDELRGPPGPD